LFLIIHFFVPKKSCPRPPHLNPVSAPVLPSAYFPSFPNPLYTLQTSPWSHSSLCILSILLPRFVLPLYTFHPFPVYSPSFSLEPSFPCILSILLPRSVFPLYILHSFLFIYPFLCILNPSFSLYPPFPLYTLHPSLCIFSIQFPQSELELLTFWTIGHWNCTRLPRVYSSSNKQ